MIKFMILDLRFKILLAMRTRMFVPIASVCLTFVFCVSFAYAANAAEFYFTTAQPSIGVGQKTEVRVFADTQGETINAVGGKIILPKNFIFDSIVTGNSLVPLWIDGPKLISENGNDEVVFLGVIPGGVNTASGPLFSFVLMAKEAGSPTLVVTGMQLLLNDGLGTATAVSSKSLTINIGPSAVGGGYEAASDSIPPESFVPLINRDLSIFDGSWFVAWSTLDKQSGLKEYSVFESRKNYMDADLLKSDIPWQVATSPRPIADQSLRSFVYIKAVDYAGNARFVRSAPAAVPLYKNYAFWSIIIGIVILALFINYEIKKYLCRQK